MSTDTKGTNAPSLAETLAKFSQEELAAFVADFSRKTESVAKANEVLTAKTYPEGERDDEFASLDDVRDEFFKFADMVARTIVVTPGDPNGKQDRSRADKRQILIPTPDGDLHVTLTHK